MILITSDSVYPSVGRKGNEKKKYSVKIKNTSVRNEQIFLVCTPEYVINLPYNILVHENIYIIIPCIALLYINSKEVDVVERFGKYKHTCRNDIRHCLTYDSTLQYLSSLSSSNI